MSYVIPSVLVYQQLENSGGVANSTPDLPACIVGPCFSETTYEAGSVESLVKSAAKSSVSTTGKTVASSKDVLVASVLGFSVGDEVAVEGAGAKGATLSATVASISGSTLTLDAAASVALDSTAISKKGRISNPLVSNSFSLPNVKPGQVVDTASFNVWLNNAVVETLSTNVIGFAGLTSVKPAEASTTGTGSVGGATLELGSGSGLVRGDVITIAGAGPNATTLLTEVVEVSGNDIQISGTLAASVSGAAVVKQLPLAYGMFSNTPTVSAGDTVVFSYLDTSSAARTFTTGVRSVIAGAAGVVSVSLMDPMPEGFSNKTTGTITGGSNSLSVNSAVGIAQGATLTLVGASNTLVVSVDAVTGSTITLTENVAVGGSYEVVVGKSATMFVRKTYQDQLVPTESPRRGTEQLTTSNLGDEYEFLVNASPELVYGYVLSADVHAEYRAMRTDLAGSVLEIANVDDLEGVLGAPSDTNPLALGVQIALANTTESVFAIALGSDDLQGYQDALDLSENTRLYSMVPLSQKTEIVSLFKTHVTQMSTPENASWRAAILNTEIPEFINVGPYSEDYVNMNEGGNTVTTVSGKKVLTSSASTFLSDGVVAGDIVTITSVDGEENPAEDGNGAPGLAGKYIVQEVISNQALVLDSTLDGEGVEFYVSRKLTKTQQADHVALTSEQFGSNRVLHVQPDIVGISVNGVTKYLPGYYLCCAIAGMTAGFPVQQGFTNIGLAGITDLKHSNFYFTRAQLNRMAEKGTFLLVQDTQGGIPYVRHELTTDMSVLEYREFLVVKNWDFLSYYFRDKMTPFIGSWNITPDTLNVMRQTIVASAELLKSKKLPKIGPPLLDYSLKSIAQNANNKDNVDVVLNISVVYPNNYTNIYLVI